MPPQTWWAAFGTQAENSTELQHGHVTYAGLGRSPIIK